MHHGATTSHHRCAQKSAQGDVRLGLTRINERLEALDQANERRKISHKHNIHSIHLLKYHFIHLVETFIL
jgi:hypothetical protein